jgi:uncharacterized membrane-anchored protein
MFGLRRRAKMADKEKAAYENGRKAGAAIIAAVDAFFDPNIEQVTSRTVAIFKAQLEKVGANADVAPMTHLAVEGKAFADEYDKAMLHIFNAFASSCADWLKSADEIGVRETLDEYVSNKIESAKSQTALLVAGLMADAAAQLKQSD